MLGLAIAALIVAIYHVGYGVLLTSAIMTALVFLWWWNVTWLSIGVLFMTALGSGLGGGAAVKNDIGVSGTIGFSLLGGLGGALLSALIFAIPAGLALGGVYIMYYALDGHASFDTVPMANFVIGAIMYGITLLMSIANRGSSNSKD